MIYAYIVISAALIPILNLFFPIFQQENSWWLVPVLLLAFIIGFIAVQMATLLLLAFFTDTNKPVSAFKSRFFRFIVRNSLPIIVKCARVKINFVGDEDNLPTNSKFLLVCNHQHDFDPVIILSSFPKVDLAFIGKKEIYTEKPFIAKAMHVLNSLPIDRENDREAAKTIIKAIKIIKDDTASICLFPEGYVSSSCELLPFRNGSLKIAIKANVPIVVCALNNTREIPKNLCRRRTNVEFRLLDVIEPSRFEGLNTAELGDIIHSKMETALKEMRG